VRNDVRESPVSCAARYHLRRCAVHVDAVPEDAWASQQHLHDPCEVVGGGMVQRVVPHVIRAVHVQGDCRHDIRTGQIVRANTLSMCMGRSGFMCTVRTFHTAAVGCEHQLQSTILHTHAAQGGESGSLPFHTNAPLATLPMLVVTKWDGGGGGSPRWPVPGGGRPVLGRWSARGEWSPFPRSTPPEGRRDLQAHAGYPRRLGPRAAGTCSECWGLGQGWEWAIGSFQHLVARLVART
jgi:hypothetical protein